MYKLKAELIEKDKDKNRVIAVASSNLVDRHGEIVDVSGWDYKSFKKQPRILWAHDHTIPAIGRAVKIWVDGKGKSAKLMFEAEFQEITDFGKQAKQLVMDGWIDTFSVGFKANEMEGNKFTDQELLEVSLVNVPANVDAQVVAYKSFSDAGICERDMEKLGVNPLFIELKQQLDMMSPKVDSMVKALKTVNPDKGRSEVTKARLSLAKVMVRSADQILTIKSDPNTVAHAKVMKRSAEKMIHSVRKDL